MTTKRLARRKATRVAYVRHRHIENVVLRRLDLLSDSLDELTAMLHRAFARLGAMGLNCTCVDQSTEVTRSRTASGECYVAVCDGRIVGTVTLHAPDRNSRCALYHQPDVASMRQFGVDPTWQDRGIGKLLLALANRWAAKRGYARLALDTPSPAAHLLAFYRHHGFRVVDSVRFDGKRYDSAILSKLLTPAAATSVRSYRLELPLCAVACAA